MNDKKLKRLFDYQKFEGNSAMNFAIQSARSYIDSLQNNTSSFQLNDEELEMVNAAGLIDTIKEVAKAKLPLGLDDKEIL